MILRYQRLGMFGKGLFILATHCNIDAGVTNAMI
jgi:hypothetical protein